MENPSQAERPRETPPTPVVPSVEAKKVSARVVDLGDRWEVYLPGREPFLVSKHGYRYELEVFSKLPPPHGLTAEEVRAVLEALESSRAPEVTPAEGATAERAAPASLVEALEYLKSNLDTLLAGALDSRGYGNVSTAFTKLKIEEKAEVYYAVLSKLFRFVKVRPRDPQGEWAVYVAEGDVLYDINVVIDPAVGYLVSRGLARSSLRRELEYAVYDTPEEVEYHQIDPWGYLRLRRKVLDLRELKLLDHVPYYFRYRLNVDIEEGELREIREGGYRVEDNEVYKLWRNHFEEEDWEYLTHSLGTWLAPYRFRHLAFLIGPAGYGKSTLLRFLTLPIDPVVARVSLRTLSSYQFGREPLVGRQIIVYSERGEVVLRNIDVLNTIFGEHDWVEVARKHKTTVWVPSLKAGMFSMNDPPVLQEYGGETLRAFLERLSIVMVKHEIPGFTPRKDIYVSPGESFKFLLWCRVQLERSNWEVRKRSEEDILEYLMEATNPVLRFLEDPGYVVKDPSGRVKGTELYAAYVRWCRERGVTPVSLTNFYAVVGSRYARYTREKTTWFKGLRIKSEVLEQPPTPED